MKKTVLLVAALFLLLFALPALADTGYTQVSMIPMAVTEDFTVSVECQSAEQVDPDHVFLHTTYPLDEVGVDKITAQYNPDSAHQVSFVFSKKDGSFIMNGNGIMGYASYEEAVQAYIDSGCSLTQILFTKTQENMEATLTYDCAAHRYTTYSEQDIYFTNATKQVENQVYRWNRIDYDENGICMHPSAQFRKNGFQVQLSFDQYGRLIYGLYYPDINNLRNIYHLDVQTGIFTSIDDPSLQCTLEDLGIPAEQAVAPAFLSIPPKSDSISEKLAGAHDITVNAGETVTLRKSDFSLYPEGSLFNGRCTLERATFYLYGYNYFFQGRAIPVDENGNEISGDDPTDVYRYRVDTPGYYPMYAYLYYEDEFDQMDYFLESDYFLVTVNDENGNPPETNPVLSVYPIPSAVVGDTVQVNCAMYDLIRPYSVANIQVSRDGDVLETWSYLDGIRDTFTVNDAGEYTVTVTYVDRIGKTAEDSCTFTVTQPGPLTLRSLTLAPDPHMPGYPRLQWVLDYEGGYGNKTTQLTLVNLLTGEEINTDTDGGFFPSWVVGNLPDGVYQLTLHMFDDEGDHVIVSNTCAVGEAPDFDAFVLPADLIHIEDGAFRGVDAAYVRVPQGCLTVGAQAFADSSLSAISLPDTVSFIAEDALPAGTVVYAPAGSFAAEWAAEHGYAVIRAE